jgi:hypothetical protein
MIERRYIGYSIDFEWDYWAPMKERLTGRVHTCDNGSTQLEVEREPETIRYGFLWLKSRQEQRREWVKREHLRFCEERTVDDPLTFLRSTLGKEGGQ